MTNDINKGQIDEFGLINPELYNNHQIERVTQQCEKRVAQYEKDRTTLKNSLNKFNELIEHLFKEQESSIKKLISVMKDKKYLSLFFNASFLEGKMPNDFSDIDLYFRKNLLIFRYDYSETILDLFKQKIEFSYENTTNKAMPYLERLEISKLFLKNIDFNELTNAIISYNTQQQEKFIKRFSKLFYDRDISKIYGKNVSCGSHWAWDDRYFIFTFNGKCYHYEDYNSGAYTNRPCHQFCRFRLIDFDDARQNSYDAKTILDITPQSVGLIMSSGGDIMGGKIDLAKLDQIANDYLSKNNKEEK